MKTERLKKDVPFLYSFLAYAVETSIKMRLLFIGDVVGQVGCEFLMKKLPDYKKENGVDICIVNGENSAQGNGVTPFS